MATLQKPWKAEYAKSARSSCKTCKNTIDKEKFRLGKMVQATQFDGFMPMWNHADCILKKANQIKSLDDVEGIESLRWEDQQKIRKYIEGGGSSSSTTTATATATVTECGVEVSQTSRATCKCCSQKIMKGEVRISHKPDGQGARSLAWHHAKCFFDLFPSTQMEKLPGWHSLSDSDRSNCSCSGQKGTKVEVQEDKELLRQSTSKGGNKRKKDVTGDQKSKVVKAEGDVSVGKAVSEKNANNLGEGHLKAPDLESKLEAQSKELWALKDDLKKHVTTVELREMLEANGQDSPGSELDLRDRCADGMLFGALGRCPICSGCLRYSGGMYRCHGYLSAWSKCSYSTAEPERLEGKWKIPDETSNQYLCKWFKSQKGKKPVRILPPPSANVPSGSQAVNSPSQSLKSDRLENLKVAIAGAPKESMKEWKSKIEGAGGMVHAKIKKGWFFLDRRMKLPIVREDYLDDCVKRQKKLPFDLYKIEAIDDRGAECYVFRKWGRVGNDKIGGTKLEEMSKSDAIQEFKRLFLEKTGNPWEAWEQKKNFQKQPGRFFPLDIDYGVNKQVSENSPSDANSQLAPPLVELMKMLFNVETYRAAMMEFEINMSEMPLGKLSKSNIQKGFEALTEIQNLLNSGAHDPSIKESLIVDASNRFFTVIPSIHPHIIRDEVDFKSKVKMLEALQDIEIASRLVGFDADNDDSLDEKYKKLCCNIAPLPHDSEDYRLIEKYLLTTHAPTHTVGLYFNRAIKTV
ncbi:hypothetical protein L1049_004271 [Liquidambar formosana]|uniref:Poly [ADP-ribose] polymerase 1 n=1 Tax=Liquidambar formosana TaxID=63359 RepID=A0AAP0RTJ9_LIQFO